jgi:hypothetical protein
MIPPYTEPSPPCRHCGTPYTAVTCACRGCKDVAFACTCDEAVNETFAREGLCDGCFAAGCIEGVADFVRCRRLAPQA